MARLLAPAVGLFGLGLLLSAGCSGSSFTESGGGGTSSAGTEPVAGSSSGGSSHNGGGTNGGTTAGGSASGGSASGGSENGGSASGGASTGGTGGSGTGGSGTAGSGGTTSVVCMQDSDCVQCDYVAVPSKPSDCCNNCNWMPLTKKECDVRKTAHDKYCANIHPLCPAIACVQPPEALCKDGMCISGKAP